MAPVDSGALLPRIAAGEPGAAGQLMETYGNLVWSIARRMLGNGSDTEDAVQDTFIELWRHAGRFNPAKGAEVAFVSTIARRRVVDRVRRRHRRPDSVELPEDFEAAEEIEAKSIAMLAINGASGLLSTNLTVLSSTLSIDWMMFAMSMPTKYSYWPPEIL